MLFEIYTDGSSYVKGEHRECSSAFMLYCNDKLIVSGGAYYNPGTNNRGEVMAVLLGLRCLHERVKRIDTTRLKPPYNVRIIGDSLLTIEGCRSWIYSWLKHSKNGILINSSNVPVINGDVFKDIHKKYTTNDLFNIEFVHVNSHVLDSGYDKYGVLINDYFARKANGCKDIKPLPDAVYSTALFKKAMKTYCTTNKSKIDHEELLRMLIHNKSCDDLASLYIRKKTMKPILLNGTEG